MKLIFSYNKDNTLFGNFENLLNTVKSFSDIKIGLGAKSSEYGSYEEIIPFLNIAYTDNCVIGFQPYHTSSQSFKSFQNNQPSNYENFNCFLLYQTDKNYGVFRSSRNSVVYNEITFRKNGYKYYNWYERNLDYKFLYNSIIDRNDTKKLEKLIDGIRRGYNLKIRFLLNDVYYILTPTIKYFNFSNNPKSLCIKTYPFIDISEIEKNQRFLLKECLININGDISILESKEYFLEKKNFFFERIFHFLSKNLNINFQLSKKDIIKTQNFQKQEIDWFFY